MTMDQSPCGCTWKRLPGWGDVIVVQCVRHAAETAAYWRKAARDAMKGKGSGA